MEQESNFGKNFVRVVLPWVIAVAALALYLGTFNHWVSILNLETVGNVAGWNWVPDMHMPLYFLVTYPFRWLPVSVIPLAMNLFAVVCAVLTLALLARSVALLPHDRTDDQRQRIKGKEAFLSIRSAWLPPVLAVIVCGLQITFWEHATNASGEMFDLLLFAYLVRCLLEYRIDGRQTWLTRSAVLYGLGMTNNWALIAYFPIFIMALIWLMGWKFFNVRFITKMALLGLAGLSLYFLLPVIQMFSDTAPLSFWVGLKGNLLGQKNVLSQMVFHRQTILLLSLVSLLPIFIISIRWPSYFGDPSPLGVALATITFHIAHGLFLVACIWVAFDPEFSPRQMLRPVPLLTLYYLAALSIGYFSGYFLVVFNPRPPRSDQNRPLTWMKQINIIVMGLVWGLFIVAAGGLLYKNLPAIQTTNGPDIIRYAEFLTENLPDHAAFISDDSFHLRLAEAALARPGRAQDHIAIDSQAFKVPQYHNYLRKRYGTNWSEPLGHKSDQLYQDQELLDLITHLAAQRRVYYLHPSFGYYFESFRSTLRGMTPELKRYQPNEVFPPSLTDAEISENEVFWKKVDAEAFPSLLKANVPQEDAVTNHTFHQFFYDTLHLKEEPNVTALIVASLYSQPLNAWGVELQKLNQLDTANKYFTSALELNPNNIPAAINRDFNQSLRTGKRSVDLSKSVEDTQLPALSRLGPLDEPEICLRQSRVFAEGGLTRQAAIGLKRVIELLPNNFTARLRLAQLYIQGGMPNSALELMKEVREHPQTFVLNSTNRVDLQALEGVALFSQNKISEAENLIQRALRENPDNAYLLNTMLRVSLAFGSYTNALTAADNLLRIFPDDSATLVNKGFAHMQLDQLSAAITTFDHALSVQANNQIALFNRAITYLRANRLDESFRDYKQLETVLPGQYQVAYGLGEIAYRRKDTNAAIQNYEAYLAKAGTNSTEAQTILARLKELKGEKP